MGGGTVFVLGLVWAATPLFFLTRVNARRNGCARCEVRRVEKGGVRDILLERISPLSGSDPIDLGTLHDSDPRRSTQSASEMGKNLRQK